MRLAGHVARSGGTRGAHRVLVGKREGKRQLGRPRRIGVDNIKMGLQEVRWGTWNGLISSSRQGQVVDCCEYCNELSSSIKCGEILY
jgi:hypothetical protein